MPYYIKKEQDSNSKAALSAAVTRLDKVFSLYIRLRDSKAFGYKAFKCISCGQIKPFKMADCGHYFSRRHMSTRFDEDNAHSECSFCNRFNSEHLDGYRDNLIKKIGQQRFDLLKAKSQQAYKYSKFEIDELYKHYKEETDKMLKDK